VQPKNQNRTTNRWRSCWQFRGASGQRYRVFFDTRKRLAYIERQGIKTLIDMEVS